MEGIANRLAALLRNCHRKMQLSLSPVLPNIMIYTLVAAILSVDLQVVCPLLETRCERTA